MKKVFTLSRDEILEKSTKEEIDLYKKAACDPFRMPNKRTILFVEENDLEYYVNEAYFNFCKEKNIKLYRINLLQNEEKEITYSTWIPKAYTMNISQQIEIDFD